MQHRPDRIAAEQPRAGLQLHGLAAAEPRAVTLQQHVDDVVPGLGEAGAHGIGRFEGHVVLARAAPRQDGYPHQPVAGADGVVPLGVVGVGVGVVVVPVSGGGVYCPT
jgi:hypothetical protein